MGQPTIGTSAMPHEDPKLRVLRTIGMLEILVLSIVYNYERKLSRYIRDTLTNAEGIPWIIG